jgi:hypothetical protein
MLLLSSDALDVDGVTVFPDHVDPNQFWYLPSPVNLALMPDSTEPQFLLIEYTPDVASSGAVGGGFLNLTTWLRVEQNEQDKIVGQISSNFPNATNPHLAPAPFDDGTVQIVTLDAQGSGDTTVKTPDGMIAMVQNILGAKTPELYGDENALFGLTLSEEAVTILKDAFADGMAPAGVIYSLKFTGVRPALDVTVTADLKRVYDSFSVSLTASAYWASVGIDATFEKLRQDGTIQIKVINLAGDKDTSDKEQQALDLFKQDILTKWFEPALSPATAAAADAGGTAGGAASAVGAVKAAAQSAQPFGLALRLKMVHQDEQKTVTYDYNRMDAVQRNYAPQGYFGLLLNSIDQSKHFLQVDGSDPFFQKFSVVLTPPHDFAGVGLQSVHVALDYGDPAAAGAKHGEFVFDATHATQTTWDLFEGAVHDTNFTYTVTYAFDPGSGWDGAQDSYSLPTATTANRQLVLDPHDTLGFLAVNVQPGHIDPNLVDRVEITLNYADTNGWSTSGFFVVRSGAQPQAWKVRLTDKTQRDFSYTTHCVLKDGTTYDAVPVTSTASAVFVNDAFAGGIDVMIQPAFDPSKTKTVLIELAYIDTVANYKFAKTQVIQAASGANAVNIHIPVINAENLSYTYTVIIITSDNRQLRGQPVTTADPLIIVGDAP